MGIKGLFPFLKKVAPDAFETVKLSTFAGQTVCLDANLMMHRYAHAQGDWLKGFCFQVVSMKNANIDPVYCIDGQPPEAKNATLEKRRVQYQNALKRTQQGDANFDAHKKVFRVTPEELERLRFWCGVLGVRHIQAEGEADSLMAGLVDQGMCSAAWSEDGDMLAYGCRVLLRGWKKDTVQKVVLEDVLSALKLDSSQFRELCVLMGTDYCERSFGPVTSLKHVLRGNPIPGKCNLSLEIFAAKETVSLPPRVQPNPQLDAIVDEHFASSSAAWKYRLVEAVGGRLCLV